MTFCWFYLAFSIVVGQKAKRVWSMFFFLLILTWLLIKKFKKWINIIEVIWNVGT